MIPDESSDDSRAWGTPPLLLMITEYRLNNIIRGQQMKNMITTHDNSRAWEQQQGFRVLRFGKIT
jgi:hypothetical protein